MGRVWRRYLKEIRSPTFISATLCIKKREEKEEKGEKGEEEEEEEEE
jgi:hypothetical protein